MKFSIGLRTIKTAIGATIAIALASLIGLSYATSAGVITILSVQSTKKKSITLAKERTFSTILALALATGLFTLFGFNVLTFGVYLLLFIPLTVMFKITDGIVMSTVLVTHLLTEQNASISLLLNEALLMFIGAGIGILANLYMPSLHDEIIKTQKMIESQMKAIFLQQAKTIQTQTVDVFEESHFQALEKTLQHGFTQALKNHENAQNTQRLYYVQYMQMRLRQYQLLVNMRQSIGKLKITAQQSISLAQLITRVATCLDEENDASELMNLTEQTLQNFRNQSLPTTRDEFETRAVLFHYINELNTLLEIKQTFRQQLTTEQFDQFGCSTI